MPGNDKKSTGPVTVGVKTLPPEALEHIRASLGRRLMYLMDAFGFSNTDIANATGRTTVTVSRWRNDAQVPSDADLMKIVEYASGEGVVVDVSWLRYGNGDFPMVGRHGTPTAPRDMFRRVAPPSRVAESGPEELPRQLRILGTEFEVEALKMGANEDEMDYVRQALQSPETAKMFAYGYVEREGLSDEVIRRDYEALINALRTFVQMRVKQRDQAKRRG